MKNIVFYALLLMLALSNPLYAYLDGGSAGMLVQLLLGGFAGAIAVVKIYWHQLKSFILRLFGKKIGDDIAETLSTEMDGQENSKEYSLKNARK